MKLSQRYEKLPSSRKFPAMKLSWQETFDNLVVSHTSEKVSCLIIPISGIVLRPITGNHKYSLLNNNLPKSHESFLTCYKALCNMEAIVLIRGEQYKIVYSRIAAL